MVGVPLGTQVFDPETDEMLGEVLAQDQQLEVARGGRGGRGNARFTSATQQAPRHAEPGESGLERRLRLELKLLADVGVVGLPNAGKSTLISVISAARPKIADYPFTTLIPQLGVVGDEIGGEPFVVADLPGLIAGAAEGAGLGTQFLRHVERCRILVHLVDLSTPDESAAEDLQTVERELRAFDRDLAAKEKMIVGSKVDAVRQERRDELQRLAEKRGCTYLEISSVTSQGLPALIAELGRRLQQERPS